MPCSVVPPSLITATKQNTLRYAPCFLFVFPLFGRLIFVASLPFVFRMVIYICLIWCIFCVLVVFLCYMCGSVHFFCNIALNQSICSYE